MKLFDRREAIISFVIQMVDAPLFLFIVAKPWAGDCWHKSSRQKRPSPSSIKKAVKEVLSNATYRENAKRIQRDFARCDAPKRAVELLEQLAERKGEFAAERK